MHDQIATSATGREQSWWAEAKKQVHALVTETRSCNPVCKEAELQKIKTSGGATGCFSNAVPVDS